MPKTKNIGQRFLETLDEAVSRDEVKELFSVLTKTIREFFAQVNQKVAKNKDEMAAMLKEAKDSISGVEKRLEQKITSSESISRSDARTITRMFQQEVKRLEERSPDLLDMEILEEKVDKTAADLEKKIPTVPEFPNVQAMLDALKEELKNELEAPLKEELRILSEQLRNRRSFGGVGYTDNHVKFALGRLVKTETPSGSINGSNTSYTTTQPIHAVISLVINGEAITDDEYTVAGNTITMTTALPAALSGNSFRIVYV